MKSYHSPIKAATSFAVGVSLKNLCYAYHQSKAVISDVTLNIAPSQIISLLGASGSGKTTLLRLISGLERPSDGEIWMDEELVSSSRFVLPPEKRQTGFMFQDYALFPHLNVLENVAFGLSGLAKKERATVARFALRRLELEHKAQQHPIQLSGGEQQRVALARAIAPRPRLLLMDEPFSGLDRFLRDAIRHETLDVLRETQATCVIVTHDPEEAMAMSDKIVVLKEGFVEQQGSPQELYNQPKSLHVARFFSPLTEFIGKANGDRFESELGSLPLPGQQNIRPGPVTIALRPEAVELFPQPVIKEDVSPNYTAVVQNIEYCGEHLLVTLQCVATRRLIRSRIHQNRCPSINQGETIHYNIFWEKAFVFQA